MKEISLPVLPGETPLRSAMAVLHGTQRSALVTLRNSKPVLVRASAIVHSANSGGSVVADVGGEAIATDVVEVDNAKRWATTRMVRESAREYDLGSDTASYSVIFATKTNDFALSSLSPGRALVVTRHEDIGNRAQRAPQDCYCTTNEDDPLSGGPPPCCSMDSSHIVDCI